MIPVILIVTLAALWLMVELRGQGYANAVDSLAYKLHRHARGVRKLHAERAAVVNERWVRELES